MDHSHRADNRTREAHSLFLPVSLPGYDPPLSVKFLRLLLACQLCVSSFTLSTLCVFFQPSSLEQLSHLLANKNNESDRDNRLQTLIHRLRALIAALERRVNTLTVLKTCVWKSRPESSLDCLTCAMFAGPRTRDRHTWSLERLITSTRGSVTCRAEEG